MNKIGWFLWFIMLACTFIMKFASNDITFCVATITAFSDYTIGSYVTQKMHSRYREEFLDHLLFLLETHTELLGDVIENEQIAIAKSIRDYDGWVWR